MEWLQEHWKDIVDVITYVIAASSIIVRLTPTEADNKALDKTIKVLQLVSLNKK